MQFEVIEQITKDFGQVEIIQAPKLAGSSDARSAENLFFVSQSGMRLKKVRITLPDMTSKVRVEPGALYYMHGNLEMKASTGGGIFRGLARKVVSGESMFVNEICGRGVIYLEPTFGHFILKELNDETLIVDKSMFYAALGDIDISAHANKIISGIAGGEGFFQTKITGTGIAILFSPVPSSEVQVFNLNNSRLSVDGNFALMREASVSFTVAKSSKSWVSTLVSGEGLLQTFQGTGKVWIAPTQGTYNSLATADGLMNMSGSPTSRNTKT